MKLIEVVGRTTKTEAEAKAFIEKMYNMYHPNPMNRRQRVIVYGTGDEQTIAMFELGTSGVEEGAVEIKWFQAYPLRSGTGSKAMKELQDHARKDGITFTLYPWDKGRVSQTALMKFYKKNGFVTVNKGGKDMVWRP